MSQQVMDANELAEYLGIAISTVYKKVEYREIPFTKVGTLLRFPKWIVDEWLTKRAVKPKDSLFDQFARLAGRYHLREFLKAKGINVDRMDEEQLIEALRDAIEDLREQDEE